MTKLVMSLASKVYGSRNNNNYECLTDLILKKTENFKQLHRDYF